MKRASLAWILFALFLSAVGCGPKPAQEAPGTAAELKPALESFTAEGLLKHIKVLASDEFEGRAPGTQGERLTVRYLANEFKQIGLKPGNPDGGYLQKVPLVGLRCTPIPEPST